MIANSSPCLLVIWVLFALSREQLHGVLVELAQDRAEKWIKLSTVVCRKPVTHHQTYCIAGLQWTFMATRLTCLTVHDIQASALGFAGTAHSWSPSHHQKAHRGSHLPANPPGQPAPVPWPGKAIWNQCNHWHNWFDNNLTSLPQHHTKATSKGIRPPRSTKPPVLGTELQRAHHKDIRSKPTQPLCHWLYIYILTLPRQSNLEGWVNLNLEV